MPKPVAGIDRRPAPDTHVHEIALGSIHPNDLNPRTMFPDAEIDELATSIAQVGLLTPLIIEADPDEPGQYILVDGERRYRALQRLDAGLVQCIIRRFDDPADRVVAMITTSLQRADLTPIDEANAYQRLLDLDLTQTDIATKVGRSKGHISKRLALLKLPAAIRTLVETGDVNLETAGRLAALPKTDQAKVIAAATNNTPGAPATPGEALARELDQLDTTAPAKPHRAPKTKSNGTAKVTVTETPDGLDVDAPLAPTRAEAPAGPTVVDDDLIERLEHLGRVVLGQSQPRYSPNSVMIDVCRALRSSPEIHVDPLHVHTLLGGQDVHDRLANSSTPTDRTKLAAAYLLAALEATHSDGFLDAQAATALDRIYKDSGYRA